MVTRDVFQVLKLHSPAARAILRTFKTSLVPIYHVMHSRSYDFLYLYNFGCLFSTKPACLRKNFHGRLLFIRVFSADGHYVNSRVFLSRNYRLVVAPRKFDVLKPNICPRSEASRAYMLILRTSNFQGATIRPIVPRHKHSIVFIVHH